MFPLVHAGFELAVQLRLTLNCLPLACNAAITGMCHHTHLEIAFFPGADVNHTFPTKIFSSRLEDNWWDLGVQLISLRPHGILLIP